jgi:aspartate/methionine/tyrosine aminotransferase
MHIRPFQLERYFAEHEFTARYLLSASDCESMALAELLAMASPARLEMWRDLRLGYTESPGHPALRCAIAELYQTIDADQVLVAAPEEAIFLAMHALLQPGDHVVAVAPAYQSLHEIAHSIGCSVSLWPVRLDGGRWRVDIDELAGLFTPHTRLLTLNFPHNPTGLLPIHWEIDAILALAEEHKVSVFSDEMYRLLEYDLTTRLPALCDRYERAISLSGLSKSFALPGLRIGWLASHDRSLMERCLMLKDYTTICNSAPGEVLALMALDNRDAITARNLEIIRGNLALAQAFFAARPERFTWIPPQAGSVAFPLWQGNDPVEAFCQRLLAIKGTLLVPGCLFHVPDNHFRLGLGRRDFGVALAALEELLEQDEQ